MLTSTHEDVAWRMLRRKRSCWCNLLTTSNFCAYQCKLCVMFDVRNDYKMIVELLGGAAAAIIVHKRLQHRER